MNKGTPCKVSLVFLVPIYSVCNLTDFAVRILLVRAFSESLVSNRVSPIALLHRASTLAPILRLFMASSIYFLLTPINLCTLTSVINREIVFVCNASRRVGTGNNSFPKINCPN